MLLILFLATPPANIVITDDVDRIELNHVFSPAGEYSFSQYIFWDFNARESRFDVVDWRLVRGCRLLAGEQLVEWDRRHPNGPPRVVCGKYLPRYLWRRDAMFAVEFADKSAHWRKIRSAAFVQTWTMHDPEIEARAILPPSKRRRLSYAPKSTRD